MPPTADGFRALFEPRGVIVAGASTHPGKFGFVTLHNLLAAGYRGRVLATNLEATPVLGVPRRGVHAGRRRSRRPALGGGQGGQGRLRHVGRLRRGRRGRPPGRGRAGRAGRRARPAAGRAERPGRGVDPGLPVRADRGALPAGRPHRRGQPVGQLRVVVPELGRADRRRHQPGRQRRRRRRRRRGRLPRLLRLRPGHRRRPGLRRGRGRRPGPVRASGRSPSGCRSCS